MERINQMPPKSGKNNRTTRSTVPQSHAGAMATLMSQMRDYYPGQTLTEGTVAVWMEAWEPIVAKYGLDRFTNALWNRLRASDFFPLPQHIADECSNLKIMASELPGTRLRIYRCTACAYSFAAETQPHACQECGSPLAFAAGGSDSSAEMRRYHEEIRTRPENFVRIEDLFREAYENVARRQAGGAR